MGSKVTVTEDIFQNVVKNGRGIQMDGSPSTSRLSSDVNALIEKV